jgi:hypothetical protein
VELIAVLFMLAAGVAIALFVAAAVALEQRERAAQGVPRTPPDRERIAASLLFQIASAGGTAAGEALRAIRLRAGIAAPVTPGIDVTNWGEAYARIADAEQRGRLLETAVQIVASESRTVPLRQYVALLDLSFALGFQTDALARLREQYGFEYVDPAKAGRPREADRTSRMTLFARDERPADELLEVLGLEGTPTRQTIISSYRRLVAQHHPDRFHDAPAEVRAAAAARFVEITRAYESLLARYPD